MASQDKQGRVAVVAVGGNSIIKDNAHRELEYQWDAVRETCIHIAALVQAGYRVVVTHGNGPQVGYILRRSELAAHEVHTVPLDIIVADTQGSIGYMLQQALRNSLRKLGIDQHVHTLVTQTLVSADDPAFANPNKPIGGFLTAEEADRSRVQGWNVVEDSGRGYRRVVASPTPLEIVEVDAIRHALDHGYTVIASGGGGIPVVRREDGEIRGVFAVVDKDRASSLLATQLQADQFIISTGVPQVAINFNKPDQQYLSELTVSDAKRYAAEKQFGAGSMLPKIEAAIRYVENGGREALITDPEHILEAVQGKAGTRIMGG